MILLIAAYLLLVLVLPLALSAAIAWRALPNGRFCPHCEAETLPLRSRTARWIGTALQRTLMRRWCPACGWQGMTRVQEPLVFARRRSDAVTRVIDVRTLIVEGVTWNVRVEYWRQAGRHFGRLVFVEPSGRLWLDGQPLEAGTPEHVLDQALALSDELLLFRLRELVSD